MSLLIGPKIVIDAYNKLIAEDEMAFKGTKSTGPGGALTKAGWENAVNSIIIGPPADYPTTDDLVDADAVDLHGPATMEELYKGTAFDAKSPHFRKWNRGHSAGLNYTYPKIYWKGLGEQTQKTIADDPNSKTALYDFFSTNVISSGNMQGEYYTNYKPGVEASNQQSQQMDYTIKGQPVSKAEYVAYAQKLLNGQQSAINEQLQIMAQAKVFTAQAEEKSWTEADAGEIIKFKGNKIKW